MDLNEQKQKMEAVAGLYHMFFTGDPSRLKTSLAPEYEQFPPQRPGLEPGIDNFMKGYMEGFGSMFSDLQGETTHVLADGDYVFVRSKWTAVHTGEAFGIPATGKKVSFIAQDLHRVENGLVAQTWHLEDYFAILTQLQGDAE